MYYLGNKKLLTKSNIAIVGPRKPTEYGIKMARKFTSELTKSGLVIISGLALGIDTIVHETCIKEGGKTIAVLGSGYKNIYPEKNIDLANNIVKTGGLLLSEYSPETKAESKNFPKRNKKMSEIAQAVLVIEAGFRSGAKLTANFAHEFGKKVFVIPNPLDSKNAIGIQQLLQRGATMVFQSEQIISMIDMHYKVPLQTPVNLIKEEKKPLEEKIYQILSEGRKHINEITKKINADRTLIVNTLVEMEIKGRIESFAQEYKIKKIKKGNNE